MAVYTVGHGTLSPDALADLLGGAGIERVVDVRRFPGSRRHPHANREALASWLPEVGVGYRWEEALGGRRHRAPDSPHVAIRDPGFRAYADHMGSPEFAAGVARLVAEARDHDVTVMCAEAVWWRCHRRFVADAVSALHGLPVHHLLHDGRVDAHRLTEGGRVVDDRIVYDAAQPPLFGG